MAYNFTDATLLGYQVNKNYLGEGLFTTNTTKSISIEGIFLNLQSTEGVTTSTQKIENFLTGIVNQYDSVIVNGYNLGSGKVLNLSFPEKNPIRLGRYVYDIEILENSDFSNAPSGDIYGTYLSGVRDKIVNLDENINFDYAENGDYSYNHGINIQFYDDKTSDLFTKSKDFANSAFYDNLNIGLIGPFSGFYNTLKNKKNYFTEAYDLINKKCSFSKKILINKNYNTNYTITVNHNINFEGDGKLTVEEQGTIKALDNTLNYTAEQYLNTELNRSYTRCNLMGGAYAYKYGLGGVTNTFVDSLRSTRSKLGITRDWFNNTIQYNVIYTNDPAFSNFGYIHTYNTTISKDLQDIFNYSEQGEITRFGQIGTINNLNTIKGIYSSAKTRAANSYPTYKLKSSSLSLGNLLGSTVIKSGIYLLDSGIIGTGGYSLAGYPHGTLKAPNQKFFISSNNGQYVHVLNNINSPLANTGSWNSINTTLFGCNPDLSYNYSGNLVYGMSNYIYSIDPTTLSVTPNYGIPGFGGCNGAFTNDGENIYISVDQNVKKYRISDNQFLQDYNFGAGFIHAIKVTPDNQYILGTTINDYFPYGTGSGKLIKIKISDGTISVLDMSATIPAPTDDFAIIGDYIYVGDEGYTRGAKINWKTMTIEQTINLPNLCWAVATDQKYVIFAGRGSNQMAAWNHETSKLYILNVPVNLPYNEAINELVNISDNTWLATSYKTNDAPIFRFNIYPENFYIYDSGTYNNQFTYSIEKTSDNSIIENHPYYKSLTFKIDDQTPTNLYKEYIIPNRDIKNVLFVSGNQVEIGNKTVNINGTLVRPTGNFWQGPIAFPLNDLKSKSISGAFDLISTESFIDGISYEYDSDNNFSFNLNVKYLKKI